MDPFKIKKIGYGTIDYGTFFTGVYSEEDDFFSSSDSDDEWANESIDIIETTVAMGERIRWDYDLIIELSGLRNIDIEFYRSDINHLENGIEENNVSIDRKLQWIECCKRASLTGL